MELPPVRGGAERGILGLAPFGCEGVELGLELAGTGSGSTKFEADSGCCCGGGNTCVGI